MAKPLEKLTIKGFKSIESLVDFELGALTVLIGANGAGKSNFVDFFRMVRALAGESLQKFVMDRSRADGFFYLGPKQTRQISAHLDLGDFAYEFKLSPTASGQMMIDQERIEIDGQWDEIRGHGSFESWLESTKDWGPAWLEGDYRTPRYCHESLTSRTVYHFHDTTMLAPMRRYESVGDRYVLRHDASNIAAFLLDMRERCNASYTLIRDTIRLIAPFFDDFVLEPKMMGPEELVRLEWRQRGSDYLFEPYHLSDGTIRFICLATALLQPVLPATVVIDEPELGLHPSGIGLLGSLVQSASTRTQVIISTQSPTLLDEFEPQDVVVVNRREGRSTFERLNPESLREWLTEYSVAELWQKNVLDGGPRRD
jgi:predicted ATPase